MNQENNKVALQEEKVDILTGVIDQESKTYTFSAEVNIQGIKKKGTFKAKYLGVAARLRLGTIRAKLLDGAPAQSLDSLTDDIAYMIAYLTVALVETPSWWIYEELEEIEDLRKIYLEVYEFCKSFRTKDAKNSNAGDSTTSIGKENVEDK